MSIGVAFLGFLMVTVYHVYLKTTKKCCKTNPPANPQPDERIDLMEVDEEEDDEEEEEIKTSSTVFNLSREPLLELNSM